MNEVVALVLVLVLATSGYAAGRLHGQFSYRLGYRFGYRQGYFDGDRASWSRRRRELQAVVASVLATPAGERAELFPTVAGTTYTSGASRDDDGDADEDTSVDVPGAPAAGRHARGAWALVGPQG